MQKIPKVIHQTWHRDNNPEILKRVEEWKNINPGYTHNFCDERGMLIYIEDNFDEDVVDCFKRIKNIQLKSDFWRHCVIYNEGGVYIDADTLPIKGLHELIDDDDDIIICITPIPHYHPEKDLSIFCNAFIAATPKHPVFLKIINTICFHIQHNMDANQIHQVSGSEPYERCVLSYFNMIDKKNETSVGYLDVKDRVKIIPHIVCDPSPRNVFTQDQHETITNINGDVILRTQINIHEDKPHSCSHYGQFWENGDELFELRDITAEDYIWIKLNSLLIRRYVYKDKARVGKYVIAADQQYDLLILSNAANKSLLEDVIALYPDTPGYVFNNDTNNIVTSGYDDVFLEIDIKGKEIDWLLNNSVILDPFKQIVITLYPYGGDNKSMDPVDLGRWNDLPSCFKKLIKSHKLIHVHADNTAGKFSVDRPDYIIERFGSSQVVELPRVVEMTFIRKGVVNEPHEQDKSPIPMDLDMCSESNLDEVTLTGWPWI